MSPWERLPPEVVFGTLRRFGVPFTDQLADMLGNGRPNAVHHVAAALLRAGGQVWTTNVDLGVETAFRTLHGALPPRAYRVPEPDASAPPPVASGLAGAGSPCLVKFHGSIDVDGSLAFTERELLAPLTAAERGPLVDAARGRDVLVYGYAGADVDLAELLGSVLRVARAVTWFEPDAERRPLISAAFRDAPIGFEPMDLAGYADGAEAVGATAAAFLQAADAAGLTAGVPDELRDQLASPLASCGGMRPVRFRLDPPSIVHARLVERFGGPQDERPALSQASLEDMRRLRLRALPAHLRWVASRSLYDDGLVARAVRVAARRRRLLGAPGLGRLRDVVIRRHTAVLLAGGGWEELQDFTDWAIQVRRQPDGNPEPDDLYYRSHARRYALRTAEARVDAEQAMAGLSVDRDPERLCGAVLELGILAVYQGRFTAALAHADDLADRRGRYAIRRWNAWGHWLEGYTRCYLAETSQAQDCFTRAEAYFSAEGSTHRLTDIAIGRLLADRVACAVGEMHGPPTVAGLLDQASPRQRDDICLLLADHALARGDSGEARTRLDEVMARASCPAATEWAELGLAELDRLEGRPTTFSAIRDRARASGSTWLELQALLGMVLTAETDAQTATHEIDGRLPELGRTVQSIHDLAVGTPRVLWMIT